MSSIRPEQSLDFWPPPSPLRTGSSTSDSTDQSSLIYSSEWSFNSSTPSAITNPDEIVLPPIVEGNMVAEGGPGNVLPCLACCKTFPLFPAQPWIDHIVQYHCNCNVPENFDCCGCMENSTWPQGQSRKVWYEGCLEHAASHFQEDESAAANMKPDFYLLSHLRDIGGIAKPYLASRAEQYTSDKRLKPFGYVSEEERVRQERASQQVHNDRKEKRESRQAARKGHKGVGKPVPLSSGAEVIVFDVPEKQPVVIWSPTSNHPHSTY